MKKILIKLPSKLEELACAWPFFELLCEHDKDDQIQVVYDEKLAPWYEWPIQGLESFKLPHKDRSLLGVHKYSVRENDIFNIDIYIDLEGSLISAYMGYCFKAKQRFGVHSNAWAKIFYHQRVMSTQGQSLDERYIMILEKVLEQSFSDYQFEPSSPPVPEQEDLFKTLNPRDCTLVVLNQLNEETIDFWGQFFNGFSQQKFIIVGLEQSFALRDLHQELGSENEYYYELSFDFLRIRALVDLCSGVICDEVWLASLLCMMGRKVQYLGQKDLPLLARVNGDFSQVVIKERDPNEACDRVHQNWNL